MKENDNLLKRKEFFLEFNLHNTYLSLLLIIISYQDDRLLLKIDTVIKLSLS